jgi:hypothetical protein
VRSRSSSTSSSARDLGLAGVALRRALAHHALAVVLELRTGTAQVVEVLVAPRLGLDQLDEQLGLRARVLLAARRLDVDAVGPRLGRIRPGSSPDGSSPIRASPPGVARSASRRPAAVLGVAGVVHGLVPGGRSTVGVGHGGLLVDWRARGAGRPPRPAASPVSLRSAGLDLDAARLGSSAFGTVIGQQPVAVGRLDGVASTRSGRRTDRWKRPKCARCGGSPRASFSS